MNAKPHIKDQKQEIPLSVGIIMDGNRRWATSKGLPTLEGHRIGYEKLTDVLAWCREFAIKDLIVYAFSTENWNRSAKEVSYLMDLFRQLIEEKISDAIKNDTRLIFPGSRERFDPDIVQKIYKAEELTRSFGSHTFAIALSYGGRAEIIDAIHRIPKDEIKTINEKDFSSLLWTKEIPDPDLIIRTSGEARLSNFLPWQSAYSELFFTKTLWPDFTREEFKRILDEYGQRQRRFGT